jgi:antitoxin component YwqK of YwqJK toxin-antitoxin module
LKFEGSFKNGKLHGQGSEYTQEMVLVYSGNWENGEYQDGTARYGILE